MEQQSVLTPTDRAAQLDELFGSSSALAGQVLDIIETEPTLSWYPDDLVDATGSNIVDVMMIVARLTNAGIVRHDGLGSGYQAKTR